MSFHAIQEMAGTISLINRIAACAAEEGILSPQQWATANIWAIVSSDGWDNDWDYAKNTYNINMNPDLGARNDVISDEKIQAAVKALIEEQATG